MLRSTYDNCKTLINAGRYAYDAMLTKLDVFFMTDRIDVDQYIELTGMIAPPALEQEVLPENIPVPEIPPDEPPVEVPPPEPTVAPDTGDGGGQVQEGV